MHFGASPEVCWSAGLWADPFAVTWTYMGHVQLQQVRFARVSCPKLLPLPRQGSFHSLCRLVECSVSPLTLHWYTPTHPVMWARPCSRQRVLRATQLPGTCTGMPQPRVCSTGLSVYWTGQRVLTAPMTAACRACAAPWLQPLGAIDMSAEGCQVCELRWVAAQGHPCIGSGQRGVSVFRLDSCAVGTGAGLPTCHR